MCVCVEGWGGELGVCAVRGCVLYVFIYVCMDLGVCALCVCVCFMVCGDLGVCAVCVCVLYVCMY